MVKVLNIRQDGKSGERARTKRKIKYDPDIYCDEFSVANGAWNEMITRFLLISLISRCDIHGELFELMMSQIPQQRGANDMHFRDPKIAMTSRRVCGRFPGFIAVR